MRIFLDANIIFSAAKSPEAIRKLLALLSANGHELVADNYVVEQARRNLEAKYSETLGDLQKLLKTVRVAGVAISVPIPPEIELVEKDRPVLASAIALKCVALVTGDAAHFGHLYGQSVTGVEIHSPRSIAELLL